MASETLGGLRVRLTVWYVATLGAILVALGGGLFAYIRHRIATELDASLVHATREVERAARIREVERRAKGPVLDAVDELRIPDRTLYLLDRDGRDAASRHADAWVRTAAMRSLARGTADVTHELPNGDDRARELRLHAQRFTLRGGDTLIAVAVADQVELEDRYAKLIAAFSAAALAALVLVAAGGWLLVRESTRPIERTFAHMRRFMADAAHELRTPTTVLRSRAEIALQQPRDAAAYVAALESIEAESARMGRLVDDLLTLARADAGERPIARESTYLDDIVDDAVRAAQALASRRGVALAIASFEEAPVTGDAALLRQLAMILLDNAIKFTPAGGRVSVHVERDAAGGARLRVSDTGVGIAADALPHVFERFYRADAARTRDNTDAAGGAGLGLSIARWIADAHGATIRLSSEPERGTEATVDFPPDAVPVSRR